MSDAAMGVDEIMQHFAGIHERKIASVSAAMRAARPLDVTKAPVDFYKAPSASVKVKVWHSEDALHGHKELTRHGGIKDAIHTYLLRSGRKEINVMHAGRLGVATLSTSGGGHLPAKSAVSVLWHRTPRGAMFHKTKSGKKVYKKK